MHFNGCMSATESGYNIPIARSADQNGAKFSKEMCLGSGKFVDISNGEAGHLADTQGGETTRRRPDPGAGETELTDKHLIKHLPVLCSALSNSDLSFSLSLKQPRLVIAWKRGR